MIDNNVIPLLFVIHIKMSHQTPMLPSYFSHFFWLWSASLLSETTQWCNILTAWIGKELLFSSLQLVLENKLIAHRSDWTSFSHVHHSLTASNVAVLSCLTIFCNPALNFHGNCSLFYHHQTSNATTAHQYNSTKFPNQQGQFWQWHDVSNH